MSTMAGDFLKQLDSLDENKLQARCEELTEEVQLLLESSDAIVQAELVNTFLQKTVFHVTESETESMFKALLPAAEKVCDNVFNDLQTWKDVNQITNLLQAPTGVLDAMTACCQCVEQKDWQQPALLAILLPSAFRAARATYTHCQDSSQLYGSVLESVNGPLTKLFRSATALQSSLHRLADTAATGGTPLSRQQLTLLTSVCDAVAETGQLLTRLDTRAMAEAWKCYLRLLQQLPDQLPPAVQLAGTLGFMAREVAAQLTTVRLQGHGTTSAPGGNKQLARAVKMCSFYLKLIVSLSENYVSCVGDALGDLIRLVFTLTRYSAPDGHVTDLDRAVLSQLSSQLTVASEPLLDCLMEHQTFSQVFWSSLSDCEDLGALCRLRCCLTLSRRACHLAESARTSWTADGDGERHLVAAVLRLMPLCDRELACCVPLDCEGHGRPQVSLYQHTLVTVCALVGSLTAAELRATETHLWRHLCRSDGWTALLATDVLCFVARYGPAGLCRVYCDSAAAALSRRRCPPLRRLLCRLVPLLTEEDRAELLRRPSAAALLHPACPPALLESALLTAEQLSNRLEQLTGEQLVTLADLLYACGTSVAVHPAAPELLARLRSSLERLWRSVPSRVTGLAGTLLASGLLRATAALPTDCQLSDAQLTQALSLASDWLPGCSVPVKLGIISLLGSIRSRQFQSFMGTNSPTHFISTLYRSLLTNSSRLVRQRALDAFAAFASCTPHAQLISAAVSAPAGLQAAVSRHLQRLAVRPRGAAALSGALRRVVASSEAAAAPEVDGEVETHEETRAGSRLNGRPAAEETRARVSAGEAARPVDGEGSSLFRPVDGEGSSQSRPVDGEGSSQSRPVDSEGSGQSRLIPCDDSGQPGGTVSPLPPHEVSLLDSIQRRLTELRQGRGGPATDSGRLLRLLTDLQDRLDAG